MDDQKSLRTPYSTMDSAYSTISSSKPKERPLARVIYQFSSSEKTFLFLRAFWFAPSVFVIVLLGNVSHALVSYMASQNDRISSDDWTSTIVLTSFMWSAITSLGIDTALHFIMSLKLLGSLLHGNLPIRNSRGLRLWAKFLGMFVLADGLALVLLPVSLNTMTGWVILTIPASRIISLLTISIYIIKIDKYNYAIKNDSRVALFVVSTP